MRLPESHEGAELRAVLKDDEALSLAGVQSHATVQHREALQNHAVVQRLAAC